MKPSECGTADAERRFEEAQKNVMIDGVAAGAQVKKSQKSDLSSISHVEYILEYFDERSLGRVTSAVGLLKLRHQV